MKTKWYEILSIIAISGMIVKFDDTFPLNGINVLKLSPVELLEYWIVKLIISAFLWIPLLILYEGIKKSE